METLTKLDIILHPPTSAAVVKSLTAGPMTEDALALLGDNHTVRHTTRLLQATGFITIQEPYQWLGVPGSSGWCGYEGGEYEVKQTADKVTITDIDYTVVLDVETKNRDDIDELVVAVRRGDYLLDDVLAPQQFSFPREESPGQPPDRARDGVGAVPLPSKRLP